MGVKPYDVNIVVLGSWNPRILTPHGVASHLLELKDEAPMQVEVPLQAEVPPQIEVPLQVEVPLDTLGLPRVRHEGVIITSNPPRLIVTAETATLASLTHAQEIASRAIKFPGTTLMAAGVNVKFKVDELPEMLIAATDVPLDDSLINAGFSVKTRAITRNLEWEKGLLNLNVTENDGEAELHLNFNRQSSDPTDLCDWLRTSLEDATTACSRILALVGLVFEEEW
jgi:hypothetical protein